MKTKTKKRFRKVTLTDLPGVSRQTIRAAGASSVTSAMEALRSGQCAITAAGDDGAINVWRDDDGWWRCEFQRYMSTKGSGRFRFLANVHAWLREWWPQMRR